jgi:hypothetical protein
MATTSRGYTYPASTAHDRIWEHFETLAEDINDDVNPIFTSWTAYTPAWTSSGTAPAIGNGTIAGRYKQIGKTVHVAVRVVLGSTSTFGSGGYSFSLPVAASGLSSIDRVGSAYLRDTSGSSSGHYNGITVITAGGTVFTVFEGSAHAQLQPAIPVTWANTDFWEFSLTYEAS